MFDAAALKQASPSNIVPLMNGQSMLASLQAGGMSRWEAVGMVAGANWARVVRPLWFSYASRVLRLPTLLKALDQVAIGSPATANLWLSAWLLEHPAQGALVLANRTWVTSLPEGLAVTGSLFLYQAGLRALPANLRIGGELFLDGSGIVALPPGLEVGSNLWMRNCHAWNGRIPEDLRLGCRVFTNRYPTGLSLAQWRLRHPHGEMARG